MLENIEKHMHRNTYAFSTPEIALINILAYNILVIFFLLKKKKIALRTRFLKITEKGQPFHFTREKLRLMGP